MGGERKSTIELKSLEAVGQEKNSTVWYQTLFNIKKAASKVNRRFVPFTHFPHLPPKNPVTM